MEISVECVSLLHLHSSPNGLVMVLCRLSYRLISACDDLTSYVGLSVRYNHNFEPVSQTDFLNIDLNKVFIALGSMSQPSSSSKIDNLLANDSH
jgi:hypothetical protein